MSGQVIPMFSQDAAGMTDSSAATAGQFVRAAANLFGSVLAAAAPGGVVTPALALVMGHRLTTRGRFTGLVEVGADGQFTIEPMDAWVNRGRWTGSTVPLDGDTGRSVVAPDDAVVNVRWPDAPVSRRGDFATIIEELDGAMLADAKTPVQWLLPLSFEHLNTGSTGRAMINEQLAALQGVLAVPTGVDVGKATQIGPSPSEGALKLREQLRTDVEAAFGIIGLLSETEGVGIHGHWRVATVRTFEPLAVAIESELQPQGAGHWAVRPLEVDSRTAFRSSAGTGATCNGGIAACHGGRGSRARACHRRAGGLNHGEESNNRTVLHSGRHPANSSGHGGGDRADTRRDRRRCGGETASGQCPYWPAVRCALARAGRGCVQMNIGKGQVHTAPVGYGTLRGGPVPSRGRACPC